MTYNFLILSLLFLIPGFLVFTLRADLRSVIRIMALCSIPFAFTESLFYPAYWEPKFLFGLIDIIGFGIEDILFVIGLSAFTSTAYAFFSGNGYEPLDEISRRAMIKRCSAILGITFIMVVLVASLGIAMIYGSCLIMLGITLIICVRRNDLLMPGILGGLLSIMVYSLLCLAFNLLIPGVFNLTWHTEGFLNIFILGIPLEELMYGFAAGFAATVFYPYVFCKRFKRRYKSSGVERGRQYF